MTIVANSTNKAKDQQTGSPLEVLLAFLKLGVTHHQIFETMTAASLPPAAADHVLVVASHFMSFCFKHSSFVLGASAANENGAETARRSPASTAPLRTLAIILISRFFSGSWTDLSVGRTRVCIFVLRQIVDRNEAEPRSADDTKSLSVLGVSIIKKSARASTLALLSCDRSLNC
jgi:hypothetical protein